MWERLNVKGCAPTTTAKHASQNAENDGVAVDSALQWHTRTATLDAAGAAVTTQPRPFFEAL